MTIYEKSSYALKSISKTMLIDDLVKSSDIKYLVSFEGAILQDNVWLFQRNITQSNILHNIEFQLNNNGLYIAIDNITGVNGYFCTVRYIKA